MVRRAHGLLIAVLLGLAQLPAAEASVFAPESLLSPLIQSLCDATQAPADRIAVRYDHAQDASLPWTGSTAYLQIILNNLCY